MNRLLNCVVGCALLLCAVTVAGWARESLSLDGQWEYVYAAEDRPPAADAGWQPVRVPSVQQWRPEGPHCIWYRTTFSVPAAWVGRQVVLKVQGVKFSHRAFVNGAEVGRHVGGYEPMGYDVTSRLNPTGVNQLLIAAEDWTSLLTPGTPASPPAPSAEFVSWVNDALLYPIGSHGSEVGIWQSVSLEGAPGRVGRRCVREDVSARA